MAGILKKPEATTAQHGTEQVSPRSPAEKADGPVQMVSDAGTKVTVPAALAGILRGYKRA